MTVEAEFINNLAVPFSGGTFGGFIIGYAIKKVIKLVIIVSGSILGLMMYLQAQGFLSLHWDKISGALETGATSVSNSVITGEAGNQILSTFGIPMGSGIAVGFIFGFSRG
jgi:uncharacterized membrane protein (Fun14 family)